METILLQTKLYTPSLRSSLVLRPHLVAKLDEKRPLKLILLSAPAGYGKTTLVTEWLSQKDEGRRMKDELKTSKLHPSSFIIHPSQVVWLSLDEDDSDPQQFFNYLAEAIRPLPNIQSSLPKLLQSPQPLPAKSLMTAFVNDVTAVSTSLCLILDDYHAINSTEIDSAMAFLLDHMPPQMTLVITSRTDPGFPISRLRARGQLIELRANDLRFSEAEAAQFLQQSMGLTLSADQIAALESRTEGWIAGLQMAALSMQNREDIDSFVASFTGSHRFIMDYLLEEVLNQQSEEVQNFLMETAVLTRLCADLCDAVRHASANQKILEQLEAHNIFLIPLDDQRRWYRYHHLFADLLRQKIAPEVAHATRQKAAVWSLQNNLIRDAIDYALAAADYDFAAPVLAEHGLQFLFQGKLAILLRWLDAFPHDYLLHQPQLCLLMGWVLLNQGRLDEIEPYLLAAESAAAENAAVRAITALIRSNVARTREENHTARSEAQIALQFGPDDIMTRGVALFQLGAVQMMAGEVAEGIETLQQADLFSRQTHNLNVIFLVGGHLGLAHLLQENEAAAQAVLQATKAYAVELGLQQSPLLGYVHLGLAHLAFINYEWDEARMEVEQAIAHLQFMNEVGGLRWSLMLLAQVEQAAGNMAAAKGAFEKVTAVSLKNPELNQQHALLKTLLDTPNPSATLAKTVRLLAAGAPLSFARAAAQSSASTQPLADPLSKRELEILTLIAAGLKNREIAEQLIISLNTVLYHVKNIYSKLGVNKRTLAIIKAKELNLITQNMT